MSAVVGVPEDWAEDCERGGVVEDCAEGNGRGLNWGEIWEDWLAGGCVIGVVKVEIARWFAGCWRETYSGETCWIVSKLSVWSRCSWITVSATES